MNAFSGVAAVLLSACASPGPQCISGGPEALAPACVIAPKCRFNCDVVVTFTESEGVETPPPVTVNHDATQTLTRRRVEP